MAKDYWREPGQVNPADYVRASMAIPVFFEPFKVDVSQVVQDRSAFQQQKAVSADKRKAASKTTSFVDGGILSNFPINVFHNPNIKVARMPTFGVKLEDEDHIVPGHENVEKPSLLSFIGKVFSTIRFYYDRDFLKRNEIYENCIAHVDVAGINWLNFGMDYETQKKLFIKGAEAAKVFFLGGKFWVDGTEKDFTAFDWEKFKSERSRIVQEMKGQSDAKEQ
jgi:NTE family protein